MVDSVQEVYRHILKWENIINASGCERNHFIVRRTIDAFKRSNSMINQDNKQKVLKYELKIHRKIITNTKRYKNNKNTKIIF